MKKFWENWFRRPQGEEKGEEKPARILPPLTPWDVRAAAEEERAEILRRLSDLERNFLRFRGVEDDDQAKDDATTAKPEGPDRQVEGE